MRTLFILIFAVFSLSAMAALKEASKALDQSGSKSVYAQAGTLTGAVSFVRNIKTHLSSSEHALPWARPSANDPNTPRLQIGDVLPAGTDLHRIPRHESYRYAIVQGRRAIVDAASRQIVYVIQ
ncbi:MAG TPA: DUF1236 domain-containing protein [Microvirga sp.]|nr:DUF1236 domain-containing protein [Microvirga sp.]